MFSDFDELVGVATEAAPGSDGHCLWCDLPLAPGEVRVLRSFKPATSTWTGQQRWLALQPTAAERGSADEEGDADGDGERVVIVEGYHPQCAFQYAGAVHATCRACGRESRGFGGDRVVTRMANRVSSIAAPAVAPAAAAAAATAGGGEADDGGGHARCSEARLRSSGALSGRLYHCFACVARFVGEHRALLRGQLSAAQAQCDVAWRPRYWRNAFHRGEGKSECGKVLLPGGDTRADFLRCFDDSVGDVGGDTRGAGAHGAGGGGSGSACTARQESPPVAGAASAASAEEGGGQAPAPAVAVHTQLQAKIAAAMRQDAGVVEHERAEFPTCSPTKKQRLGALLSVDAHTANEQVAVGGEYYQARLLRQECLKSKGRAAHEGGSGKGDCSGGGAAAAAPAVPVAASTPAKSVTFKISNDDRR